MKPELWKPRGVPRKEKAFDNNINNNNNNNNGSRSMGEVLPNSGVVCILVLTKPAVQQCNWKHKPFTSLHTIW